MASFNQVILLGNVTRDIELKYLQGGTAVAEMGLAVNSKYKNKSGEWTDDVVFVDITLWGRTAEVASEHLTKGSSTLIQGRLKLDRWEKNGQKHQKLKVVAERMQLLGSKDSSQQQTIHSASTENPEETTSHSSLPETSRSGVAPRVPARAAGEDCPF
tara:strand:+ start:2347 stop:2820 length:474 start_codon:yes stop_codon:yes gene_type:complete